MAIIALMLKLQTISTLSTDPNMHCIFLENYSIVVNNIINQNRIWEKNEPIIQGFIPVL